MLNIRPATNKDHNAIWDIFHAVIAPGDTYSFDPQMSREDALAYWFGSRTQTYVAELATGRVRPNGGQDRQVAGTYILRPNQPAAGAQIAFWVHWHHPDHAAPRSGLGPAPRRPALSGAAQGIPGEWR